MVTISNGYHFQWLPFPMVTISNGYHFQWLPFPMVTISNGYHFQWLPLEMVRLLTLLSKIIWDYFINKLKNIFTSIFTK